MPFIENNHMVKQIAAAATDPALGDTVLPRTSEAGSRGMDAEALHCVDHFFVEMRATIEDQVVRRQVVGKGIAQLLDDPGAARMSGHIAVKDTPPGMRDDEEAVENTEGQRRHGEEIHCRDGFTMVAQKCRPSLCRLGTPGRFPHPAQHRSFRNIEAKHLQLSVNPWRTPGRILGNHANDQLAQFLGNAFSSDTGPMPRKPSPIQLES